MINKAVYLAIAVNIEGKKELLGIWVGKNEGAKFWMQVVTELKNRGVEQIYVACVDGLKGFPEAISSIFPNTIVQLWVKLQKRGKSELGVGIAVNFFSVIEKYPAISYLTQMPYPCRMIMFYAFIFWYI